MNVLLDARWLGAHGIGRFAQVLDGHLKLPHLNVRGSPSSPVDPLRLFLAMLRTSKETCLLSPGYNAPLFGVRQYIFSIMDLNHIDRPENSNWLKRAYYRFIMRRAARRAFRVLTISEFSRQRILDWAHIDPQRVVNVSCGVDARYHPDVDPYSPGFPYLLCVSNRKAHKNELRLIKAFACAAIDPSIRLLFTGEANDRLIALSSQCGAKTRIEFIGQVPEEHLPNVYRGALALLFPSLYEGFGLPVIEAMACGTPVLTSNTTSLPEVAGDAALLVDPSSVEEISAGIIQICSDTSLREGLRRKGLSQANRYKWVEVTARVKAVLDELENESLLST